MESLRIHGAVDFTSAAPHVYLERCLIKRRINFAFLRIYEQYGLTVIGILLSVYTYLKEKK